MSIKMKDIRRSTTRSKEKLKNPSAADAGIFAISVAIIVFSPQLVHLATAQNLTRPATDISEVRALNMVFEQWGISAPAGQWNISGEPCSGAAIDNSSFNYNPLIKCDCTFDNGSVCHITHLQVKAVSSQRPIPDELWDLTYLSNLNLEVNQLNGSLSPSIIKLTRLMYLRLSGNAFSGGLPKELGSLSNLLLLGLGSNFFSGPLPSEMGNLTKLERLYVDSTNVSGPIPPTFADLRNLNVLWLSDTAISGSLPDFIGNWLHLEELYIFGTSVYGPIPLGLSTLTSMRDLRISDIKNSGASSLAFIKDMKSLTTLILRNNNISDSIPSTIGEFSNLKHLDLSFNNLKGQIPGSLFNLKSLTFLFLGSNSLSGGLPLEKSSSLAYMQVDLSYNYLHGSFPHWVNDEDMLQLNLVGNNFIIQNQNSSSLIVTSGLRCLQRNFPCLRDSPIHSSFAIKCGGSEMKSSNDIVYEQDNGILGPAAYQVRGAQRWAVSNVGYFTDSTNSPSYIYSSQLQSITGTMDPDLYKTARISASSLRYYGLGLKNGNYTVSLHFAELAMEKKQAMFPDAARRVFDIYLQGNSVAMDFDILKEAEGSSHRAVVRNFNAQVTDNYLEIHLFWAGKGTCCSPVRPTYGPMISAISATRNFIPIASDNLEKPLSTRLILGIAIGVPALIFVAFLALYFAQRKKLRHTSEDNELLGMNTRPYTFNYVELKAATNGFSPLNKLGEGGFGPVYRGTLCDGRVIAVKQLSLSSQQGKKQFLSEIATISAVQHRNLVRLYGCCIEGDKRLLVYEYLDNKSLDQALFGQWIFNLDCPTRYGICLGVARGLAYLHEESRLRIVHRDVKASNILLDSNFIPKISDFGLAKLYEDGKTHISTVIAGTIGYLAPEYALRGILTEKADVFGFGVVALEVLSGRPNTDNSLAQEKIFLLKWAWNLQEANRAIELVDARLSSEFDEEEAKLLLRIALMCTQASPVLRPSMSRVVSMLTEDAEVSPGMARPGYLGDWICGNDSFATDTSSAIMDAQVNHRDGSSFTLSTAAGREHHQSGKCDRPDDESSFLQTQ